MTKFVLLQLCADNMRHYVLIARIIEVVVCGSLVLATVLLYRASLSTEMVKRYRWRAKLFWIIPFLERWSVSLAPEDVERVRIFRRGLFTWQFVFAASSAVLIVYFGVLAPRILLMFARGACRN